jgi:hypothetical protein
MLLLNAANTHSERILIHSPRAGVTCWIAYRYVYNSELQDWALFVKRHGQPAFSRKCPLRLEIESRLRAWMLRTYRRPLASFSYRELRAIALKRQASQAIHVA